MRHEVQVLAHLPPYVCCWSIYNFIQLTYSSNFTPQVKEARYQSQIFNRKSISRNTTHCQSYHLQAMLTGVKHRKTNTRSQKVNNLKTANEKKRTDPTVTNKTKPKCLAKLHGKAEASKLTA